MTPGFFGDDLDALELDKAPGLHTYFSIDSLSASNGFGTGTLANDIFIDYLGIVYASGEGQMGLLPQDDLDGLVLWDVIEPGILNPGIDKALFSLSTFSPSTFTFTGNSYILGRQLYLSPADVLLTDFTGNFSLWASAEAIGLRPEDNVDALDTVPEPGSFILVATGILVLMVFQHDQQRESVVVVRVKAKVGRQSAHPTYLSRLKWVADFENRNFHELQILQDGTQR